MVKGGLSRPKPWVEYVEIGSDKAKQAASRLRGALRGLDPNNVLSAPSVQSTESGGDEQVDENGHPLTSANSTGRVLRHVKVDKEKYDMKFHMMDEVTRPKRTARRRSGSGLVSRSIEREAADTDEESDLSSPQGSNGEDDSDGASTSDNDVPVSTQRAPDPNATRFSKRSEAQKPVNYSRKHHPQDFGLPGYEHKSKKLSASLPPQTKRRKLSTHDEGMFSDQAKHSRRPRKKLRSLTSDEPCPAPPSRAHASKPAPKIRGKHAKGIVALAGTSDTAASVAQMIHAPQASSARLNRHIEVANSNESTDLSDTADRSSPFTSSGLPPVTTQAQAPDDGFDFGQTPPQPSTSTSAAPLGDDQEHCVELIIIKPYLYGYEPQHLTHRTHAVGRTNQFSATDMLSSCAASSVVDIYQGFTNALDSRSEHAAATCIEDIKIMESNERSTPYQRRQMLLCANYLHPWKYWPIRHRVATLRKHSKSRNRSLSQSSSQTHDIVGFQAIYSSIGEQLKACGRPLPLTLTAQ
ncbi:hypothetical protein Tdes44962_MAKER02673 [Teratosphaeria destructans]|uniref:Uncharacterized protein n=1 Tax=Teratosphaeria destructans TaxID=418781 RepID=A0A9W7W2Z8_9PEZI|nr:hypothetical protein Tdes44962_MAKER02673 [Teratosphaeria destructans]